jgi:hypothetical protein
LASSSRVTKIIVEPARVVEVTVSTRGTCLARCSIGSVTSSSRSEADAPGQVAVTTAVLITTSGSLRWGSRRNDTSPQTSVAISATHATWRCSTK